MNDDKNIPDTEILKIDFECSTCQKSRQGTIAVSRMIEKLDELFGRNDLAGAERLLGFWRKEAVSLGDLSGELSVVNEQLGLYRKVQKQEEAEEAVARALELLFLTGTRDTVSGGTILLNAATTRKAFGGAGEAIPLYEEAEAIFARELDPDDLRHAGLYNNHATALVDLCRYDEARTLYGKAIELTKRSVESLPDCAVSYVNLAHLAENDKGPECPEIEEALMGVEAILEDERPERNGYYAFVCEKCAPSFDYFGYFLTAERLRQRARRIYEGS